MQINNVEETILGTVLAWPETFQTIHTKLAAKHFLNDKNRHIFECVEKCFEEYTEVDPSTVILKCDARKFKNIKIEDFFDDLRGNALSQNYLKEYGGYLVKRFKVNEYKSLLSETQYDDVTEENIDEVLSVINKGTDDIAYSGRIDSFTKTFKQALNESYLQMKDFVDNGVAVGMPTHIESLNSALGGLKNTHLTFIAATSGTGKSALALDLVYNISKYKDKNVLIFSLEMSAKELVDRLISQETKISYDKIINAHIDHNNLGLIITKIKEIENTKLMIIDEGGLSIRDIQARAKHYDFELKKRGEKLDIVVVDYLQLMSSTDKKKSATDHSVLTEGTMGLKNLAKDLDCNVVALSQLSKQIYNRDNPRPRTSDLKGSQSIEADSDEILFLHREAKVLRQNQPKQGTEEYENWLAELDAVSDKAEIIIGKNRHGAECSVFVGFNEQNLSFYDLTGTNSFDKNKISDDVFSEENSLV